ncbi:MAG TPA: plastocyanin/azurin family copper-binding protein [Gemmatimonadales bacterium]|jgi:plastocyanin|nr:plastocyanin/azurin family copper-binding protein [Gemmatimonadales bacterium]
MTAGARWMLFLSLAAQVACGDRSSAPPPPAGEETPAAAPAVAPTGTVVEIKAITDDKGNYFEPNQVEVHQGDVLRVVLVSGVHNIHFPADSNPGATGLPGPSDLLQLPGQTLDLPITFAPGKYFFQCDPHAALGMVGTLEVEDD